LLAATAVTPFTSLLQASPHVSVLLLLLLPLLLTTRRPLLLLLLYCSCFFIPKVSSSQSHG
jgi:hypothetical protein